MPLYEYICNKCGKRFEALQKFSDEPLKTHGECGGDVERLLSAPALQFKGSGWYVTDYARNSGANGSAEAKSSDKSETKTDTKSDAASAPKTETKSETKSSDTKSA